MDWHSIQCGEANVLVTMQYLKWNIELYQNGSSDSEVDHTWAKLDGDDSC